MWNSWDRKRAMDKPRRRLRVLAPVVIALALLGTSCTASQNVGSGAEGKELTIGIPQAPDFLDPALMNSRMARQIVYALYDPLMWVVPGEDGAHGLVPGLAKSYTVNEDATVYTFDLREDVTFHDGTPFNAEAVKTTFDHIADPATQSRIARGNLGPYKETRVVDEYRVEVVFKAPNASFETLMADATLGIISPTALKKYGKEFSRNPVGTGAFKLESWGGTETVRLVRNPNYEWGPAHLQTGESNINRLTFRVIADASSQYNALSTGEIQGAEGLTSSDARSLVDSGEFGLKSGVVSGVPYSFALNVDKAPLDDLAVRKAVLHATDSSGMVKALFDGMFDPADGIVTPNLPGYSPIPYSHDPEEAARLLDSAGWTMGADGVRTKGGKELSLELINMSDFGFDQIAQVLQTQLAEVGIKVKISDQSWPAVATTYVDGKHHLASQFYTNSSTQGIRALYACDEQALNWAHFCDEDVDRLFAEANTQTDAERRSETYSAVLDKIAAEAPMVPIYNLKTNLVHAGSLDGVYFGLDGVPVFHGAVSGD
jgi:peptide/nickel transport system substrate-binding protein